MKKCIFTLAILVSLSPAFADTANWNIAKATHFIVYYKNAPDDFIKQLIDKSEDYYNKIADGLGFRRFDFWLWDNRAKIYIYDNAEDYQAATGQPSWSGGSALTSQKIIQTFPYAKGFFENILAHEMGHIIFREFAGFDNQSIPLWLEEGVASYQEKLKYSSTDKIIKEAMVKGSFMGIEKLSSFDMRSVADTELVQLFYIEAFSIVNFLLKEYGNDNFVLFCQNLRDKKNLEKAMVSSYPFSNMKEFDRAWQEYLKR